MIAADMPTCFAEQPLHAGQHWLYCAGFNVKQDLADTSRIDEEVPDLARLVSHGCRVTVLSHQGSHGNYQQLDYIVPYLQSKLACTVKYCDSLCWSEIYRQVDLLRDGELLLLTNSRLFEGELENKAELAEQFAGLGQRIVIGGFSKAHRSHASNVGVSRYRPSFLATGIANQIALLKPWSKNMPSALSLAVVGGIKKEKVDPGLVGLARFYDFIIPTGAVLNAILAYQNINIGGSVLPEFGQFDRSAIAQTVTQFASKLIMPEQLIVTDGVSYKKVSITQLNLTAQERIVDFVPTDEMRNVISDVVSQQGRILLAGTPADATLAHSEAIEFFEQQLTFARPYSILLGGDSCADISFDGAKSSGGGAALVYLCDGTLPILEHHNKSF
ncbi:phosphoglycerate kinase [Pseudoalteromonas byunsanensis]|uniref:Phosphoglycerate kinase n=1 Tax=Pseudoalteromonas byunsanensis TaxID=327939 RepID=A0A1S1N5A7_9GAMM|nr:phosphoglycerate kinase [Pseudoalteromonas byunsanensis]OHU95193.1 phosphoglycerate kinase [Pseudoalteromonas byunsanensis]